MMSLPRSEAVTHSYARAAAVFVCTAVLWCSAAAILAVAAVARTPDSDTGNRSSTATIIWLLVLAVVLVLASGPIAFAVARQRWLLALPLIGAGIAMLSITAAHFIG
jgi:hypothetical protein